MPKGQFTISPEAKMGLDARAQIFKWLRIYKQITGRNFNPGSLGAKRGPKPVQVAKRGPKTA